MLIHDDLSHEMLSRLRYVRRSDVENTIEVAAQCSKRIKKGFIKEA